MAINYTLPTNSTNYDEELAQLRENIVAAMTMDYTGASAIADNSVRYNRTSGAIEEYDLGTTTWNTLVVPFASGTVMLFGGATAPTGWTRYSVWADNAMLCVAQTGTPASGGTVNPQSAHTHTGGAHTHNITAHNHVIGPHNHGLGTHTHAPGTLRFETMSFQNFSSAGLNGEWYGYNSLGLDEELFSFDIVPIGTGALTNQGVSVYAQAPDNKTNYTGSGTGTTASSSGTTDNSATYSTGNSTINITQSGGAVATGQNTAPLFQEVLAAIKD